MPYTILYSLMAFTGLFIFLEIIPLVRRRSWKELSAAILILLIASLYGIDFAFQYKMLPNPNMSLYYLQPAHQMLEDYLASSGSQGDVKE